MPWAAAGMIGATLLGGLFGAKGASDQNVASAKAAKTQMDFQERMSNTQYQRSMADMKAAGLNPILAYQQGGAGTPGGSSYSPVNVGSASVAGAQSATNSAATARRVSLETRLATAQIANLQNDTSKKFAEEQLIHEQKKGATTSRFRTEQEIQNLRQLWNVRKPDVTSAKHADALLSGPGGTFFKWYKMITGR